MYKVVDTDVPFTDDTGRYIEPIQTMADKYGGRVQIIEDDHCLVPLLKRTQRGRPDDALQIEYKPTHYLFSELVETIKNMKTPQNAVRQALEVKTRE